MTSIITAAITAAMASRVSTSAAGLRSLSSFLFLGKSIFSIPLIGTFITNAITAPIRNGMKIDRTFPRNPTAEPRFLNMQYIAAEAEIIPIIFSDVFLSSCICCILP